MFNDQDKYQNLLTQIHELNRQNLLNENEKIEQVSQKIDELNQKIDNIVNTPNRSNNKLFVLIIIILLINTLSLGFLVLTNNTLTQNKIELKSQIKNIEEIPIIEKKDIEKIERNVNEDILSFNKESIEAFEKEEEFEEIKPIIRKGTQYTCKGDLKTYKIPYTVEIKGKLYSDRFSFILQEDSLTKECSIKKANM